MIRLENTGILVQGSTSTRRTGAEGVKNEYQVDKAQPGDGDSERDCNRPKFFRDKASRDIFYDPYLEWPLTVPQSENDRGRMYPQIDDGKTCERKRN